MEILNTPLGNEATSIMNSGSTETSFGWDALIHFKSTDKTTGKVTDLIYKPASVVAVVIRRDYARSYTDEMTCSFLIPLGKYARQIYPSRNDLQISLSKVPFGETTDDISKDIEIQTERYSATLIDKGQSITEAQGTETNDEYSLDLTNVLEVHFQLYNKAIEQLRLISVGGVYRKVNVGALVQTMLTTESSKINIDNIRAVEGVSMLAVSNKEKKEQIVITQGTRLTDVPDYLQKTIGIYNAGIGSYIQGKQWYVYSLFDTTKFNDRKDTLTIIVLPKKKFPNLDRTYRVVNGSLTVLVTSETGYKDDSGTQYLNEGNGARFADANKMVDSSVTIKNNKAIMARGANNSEFVSGKRPDGINNVSLPGQRITSNPFSVYSDLNRRSGGLFSAVWKNSDFKLVTPGMMAKVLFFDEDEIKEYYGIMQAVDHVSHSLGLGSVRYENQSILSIFVNKAKPI
jgi:hypothetical protein